MLGWLLYRCRLISYGPDTWGHEQKLEYFCGSIMIPWVVIFIAAKWLYVSSRGSQGSVSSVVQGGTNQANKQWLCACLLPAAEDKLFEPTHLIWPSPPQKHGKCLSWFHFWHHISCGGNFWTAKRVTSWKLGWNHLNQTIRCKARDLSINPCSWAASYRLTVSIHRQCAAVTLL